MVHYHLVYITLVSLTEWMYLTLTTPERILRFIEFVDVALLENKKTCPHGQVWIDTRYFSLANSGSLTSSKAIASSFSRLVTCV